MSEEAEEPDPYRRPRLIAKLKETCSLFCFLTGTCQEEMIGLMMSAAVLFARQQRFSSETFLECANEMISLFERCKQHADAILGKKKV